jgi:hypothetical protein
MDMSSSTTLIDLDCARGAPAILGSKPDDAADWATAYHDARRAALVEHGAVLARGLPLLVGISDPVRLGGATPSGGGGR